MENFNEFEVNNLLHDSTVYFEDTKISSDSLSLMDTNIVQGIDDSLVNVNKDPATDPLFISDLEENDIDTSLMDSKSVEPEKSVCVDKQISNVNNPFEKQKHKLNEKEKHLLKELENIQNWEKLPLPFVKVS